MRVNETFLRWTGYAREDLVGVKRFQDLLSPGGRIYHETHYAPLLRMQGSVREIAVDIVAADGRRLPVLVNSVLITDAAGEPQVVRTTLFDARERKAYERELLAARDREREAREASAARAALAHAAAEPAGGRAAATTRFSIATLYQPAGEQLEVGGDWHDAFVLAGGRVGIVVGDVVGRGLPAATAMGQLRSAVRALAATGVGPAGGGRPPRHVRRAGRGGAVRDARLRRGRPGHRRVTFAAAGHLPPVLVGAAAPRLFMGGRSTPLGRRTAAAAAHRGDASSSRRATGSCSTPTASSSGARRASTTAWSACWPPRDPDARPEALRARARWRTARRRRRVRAGLPAQGCLTADGGGHSARQCSGFW